MGTVYDILLTKAETGGSLGMLRSVDQPGFGPPLHIHRDADETFHVLGGRVDFLLDGERRSLTAGGTIFIPRGAAHTFRVMDGEARMITVMTPGGFEGFFEQVVANAFEMPRDLDAMAALAATFHLEFVGPPLDA